MFGGFFPQPCKLKFIDRQRESSNNQYKLRASALLKYILPESINPVQASIKNLILIGSKNIQNFFASLPIEH